MPFARIASEWTHSNQSVPGDVATKLRRRDSPATVRGITVDTQFHKIDPNRCAPHCFTVRFASLLCNLSHGSVAMMIQGVTGNSTSLNLRRSVQNATSDDIRQRRDIDERSLFSSISHDLDKALNGVSSSKYADNKFH